MEITSCQAEKFKAARERYAYVPARLTSGPSSAEIFSHDLKWNDVKLWVHCPNQDEWNGVRAYLETRPAADVSTESLVRPVQHSSISLDNFHTELLWDKSEAANLHGLMSIMFWGYASGTDHLIKIGRATGKARMLAIGRGGERPLAPDAVKDVLNYLEEVRQYVRKRAFGEALDRASRMTFWGPSFASKLVMFANPEAAVVYDSVIWERLSNHNDGKLRRMAQAKLGSTTRQGREAVKSQYQDWCEWCLLKAKELNAVQIKWRDWDNKEHPWRAVDVERAFFALGREPS